MGRITLITLLCLIVWTPVLAEDGYAPKPGERVNWGKVFEKKGILDKEEDYADVLSREPSKDRVDWGRELRDKPRGLIESPAPAPSGQREKPQEPEEQDLEKRYKIGVPKPADEEPATPTQASDSIVEPKVSKVRPEPEAPASEPASTESVSEADEQSEPEKFSPQPAAPAPAVKPQPEGEMPQVASVEQRPEPEPEPKPEPKRLYSDETVEHFLILTFYDRDEQEAYRRGGTLPRAKVLTKWNEDLRVSVKGAASDAEREMLTEVVQVMDQAVSGVADVRVRMTEEEANVNVFFLPAREGEEMSGYVRNSYDGPNIVGSDVVFYSGRPDRADMMRQFMHVMGFLGLREQARDTIMTSGADSGSGFLPDKDAKALRILYHAGFEPGMHLDEAKTKLSKAYTY